MMSSETNSNAWQRSYRQAVKAKLRGRVRFRKLRIAWSGLFGIACVVLIVLWARSHYSVDQIFLPTTRSAFVSIGSMPDAIIAGMTGNSPTGTWAMLNMPSDEWLAAVGESRDSWSGLITFKIVDGGIVVPHWFGVLLFAALAVVPWIRRFSLRTLLIATTLVAVVLGLIVWAAR
jgi:hypothetical protein